MYYSGMPSKEYWTQRNKESLSESFYSAQQVEDYLKQVYERNLIKLCSNYNALLSPFIKDGEIDIGALNVARYTDTSFALKYNRLISQIDLFVSSMNEEQQALILKHLKNTYKNNVISTFKVFENTEKGLALLDDNAIVSAVKMPYTADGREFSTRIWDNLTNMNKNLRLTVADAVANGEAIPKTVKKFKEIYGNSTYNTNRIIRTETAAVQTKASLDSYKQLGVEFIEVLPESSACDACKANAHKKIELLKARVGENLPPIHPFCKCCVIPLVK